MKLEDYDKVAELIKPKVTWAVVANNLVAFSATKINTHIKMRID